MRFDTGMLWLAPTDLGIHLGCRHATALALVHARGAGPGPYTPGAYEQLIQAKGDLHEREYLSALENRGRKVVKIPLTDRDFNAAGQATEQAMRDGAEVIYQATFAGDGWRGRADFLERVRGPTGLGDWGYEAVDTKLARNEALPHHVLQLTVYSQWIERIQEVAPREMHLQLGSGRRETIRVAEVAAYVRRAQTALREAVMNSQPTEAYPCAHCAICGFRSYCEDTWEQTDHLTAVAGIRRDNVDALRAAGIDTLTKLAGTDPSRQVADLRPDALANLQWQARLQLQGRRRGTLPYDRLPRAEGRGFARLPHRDPGDVFLDLEGDPFWDPARELWFLFGLVLLEEGEWRYRPIWAHNPAGEAQAFEEFVDLITARRAEHPSMHVYHYSPAEPSALRCLAAQPSTREAEVDDLLRAEVFVDLYAVIRQALVVGAPGYGLKTTEKLAGFTRAADVGSGSDAVVEYERWRDTGDQALLVAIARYNDEDCRATLALRDWLVDNRPPGTPWWEHDPPSDPSVEVSDARAARLALREELVRDAEPGSGRWLAGELLEYHRREKRPAWWQWFARLEMTVDELIRDHEAIGGLTRTDVDPWLEKQSLAYEMAFPAQEHKLHAGAPVADPATEKGVTIAALDADADTLVVKRRRNRHDEPLPAALIPSGPLETKAHEAALLRFATSIRDDHRAYRALRDLLDGTPTRIAGRTAGEPIQTLDLDEQIALAKGLDESCLVVQGPPGTGKTWLGGRMIAALIADGARVGVTAVSHKAINNVLTELEAAADELGLTYQGARRIGDSPDSEFPGSDRIENHTNHADCEDPNLQMVAGTSWVFAREGHDQAFDYLVIDEAGQMSLADALAVGTSARNLILLGDPQQLPHVSQAAHVEGTGLSVLQHALGRDATIPPDRGLFLAQTWRMHPDVCGFISREIYDGRLEPHPDCVVQATGAGTGIRYVPVPHIGNTSSSRQERDAIRSAIAGLVGISHTDRHGDTRSLTPDDIMVVAPYNAHVRMLRQALPGVRVGTVDKFQGQEAPVVFFSMATSTGDDMLRDAEFLFSRNRLNVAISRARCLAYLVCSPALLEARARTVDDMRLISTLCALVEEADRQLAEGRVTT